MGPPFLSLLLSLSLSHRQRSPEPTHRCCRRPRPRPAALPRALGRGRGSHRAWPRPTCRPRRSGAVPAVPWPCHARAVPAAPAVPCHPRPVSPAVPASPRGAPAIPCPPRATVGLGPCSARPCHRRLDSSASPTPGVRYDSVNVRDSVVGHVKIVNMQCTYLVSFDCSVVVLIFVIY